MICIVGAIILVCSVGAGLLVYLRLGELQEAIRAEQREGGERD